MPDLSFSSTVLLTRLLNTTVYGRSLGYAHEDFTSVYGLHTLDASSKILQFVHTRDVARLDQMPVGGGEESVSA